MHSVVEIKLNDKFVNYHIVSKDNLKSENIVDLSKVNIFVGANNSGKSRFMRLLAAEQNLKYKPNIDFDKINIIIDNCINAVNDVLNMFNDRYQGYSQPEAIIDLKKYLTKDYFITNGVAILSQLGSFFSIVYGDQPIKYVKNNTWQNSTHINELIKDKVLDDKKLYDEEIENVNNKIDFKYLYIPTLRGLRNFGDNNDYYKERTVNDYFENSKPIIFTGLDFYEKLKSLLLGDLKQREVVVQFQNFLSNTFFNDSKVALIPRNKSDVIFVKIGDEPEFPIYDLGDGIQSIILLTFPLFELKEEKLLVFIEEPEIYMHPGLQRVLLNTLMGFFNHQFFFTTHSNHFLDLSMDYNKISIYTFAKEFTNTVDGVLDTKFKVNNVSNKDMTTLQLLGVKNSSVFLSNCTIWVEGITDRKYFSCYLKLYINYLNEHAPQKHISLKEDLHYSFVEYSGGNITHWSFYDKESGINVDRLCGRLLLIADNDNDNNKLQRKQQLKKQLGDRFYILKAQEVENLLTPDILNSILKEYEGINVTTNYSQKDYINEPLGKYIENVILKSKKKRRGKYSASSGTITDKISFCNKAISHINKYEQLSSEAKAVTKLIFNFIIKHNP